MRQSTFSTNGTDEFKLPTDHSGRVGPSLWMVTCILAMARYAWYLPNRARIYFFCVGIHGEQVLF